MGHDPERADAPDQPQRSDSRDHPENVPSPEDTITTVPIEYELDLHAFAPKDVASVVDEFVRAASESGLQQVRLVHGRGRGVQRATVHRILAQHPLVVRFHDDPASHLGATLVQLLSRP